MKEIRASYETGKTITAHIVNSVTASDTNLALNETSAGYYVGDFPALVAGTYDVSFYEGSTLLNGAGTLVWDGTQEVSSFTPYDPASHMLSINAGDDYLAVDGRAFTFTYAGQPSLIGATVTLKAQSRQDGDVDVEVAAIVVNGTTIVIEMPKAKTIKLHAGTQAYDYDIKATLSNGDVVTLQSGIITVIADIE